MRTATLRAFLAVVATQATASSLHRRQFPSCAVPCLTDADFGSCDPLDDVCLCESADFLDSVETCLDRSCIGEDAVDANLALEQLCAAVGVPTHK
ncbi:hypothetical protein C8Q78DRAFT_1077808 [Trametes maxima]|nr:hypothetical protein C8Q78DRAFT_1077808 [Trametes maxima]